MAEVIHRNRPMTWQEKENAMSVSPKEYPQELPCSVCGFRWMQHKGTLCPIRPGYMSKFLKDKNGNPLVIPPSFGDTTFIPDAAYFNQNPDFDVQ